MKRFLLLIPISFMLFACSNPRVETKGNASKDTIVATGSTPEINEGVWLPANTPGDTLTINYAENKDLLEILQNLPDSSFGDWYWSKKSRTGFVKFVSANNFIVDTKEDFILIRQVKPNTIDIQVVDGAWSLSIYKAADGSYRVITDMITGDWDNMHAYEYNKGKLKALKLDQLLGNYFKELLVQQDNAGCLKFVEANDITFDYNFNDRSNVRISSSYLNKDRSENCLKGNVLDLRFNAQSKRFELSKVTWLED